MQYILNLYAFTLPLLLFSFWGIVGYATLSLLSTRHNFLQNVLLAPVTGFAVTLICVFTLNRFGLPISSFAKILLFTLLIFSLITLKFNKPFFAVRYYSPFIAIFLLALCIAGYPLLEYGFNWISFGNEDMMNYCLGAFRFLRYGFFDIPDYRILLNNQDYSLYHWFNHVPGLVRSGSELTLAWVSTVTNLNTLQIFMPQLLAFHLILISSTGALVCLHKNKLSFAITTCLLFSFSALSIFGTMYQLIAQIQGLSLLIITLILLFQLFENEKKYYSISHSILLSVIISSFLITYPELLSFLVLTFITYNLIMLLNRKLPSKMFFVILIFTSIFTIILLNNYMFSVMEFAYIQIMNGSSSANSSIFPYYFLLSGIANLWGLLPITQKPGEPWTTIAIIFGFLLSIMSILISLRYWLKGSIAAIMLIIMTAFGMLLFLRNSGFGLFKLAMFSQPFLFCIITYALFDLIKNSKLRNCIMIFFISLSLFSIHYYVTRSKALHPGPFAEIAYGSKSKISDEYVHSLSKLPPDAILFTDEFNVSILKMQSLLSYSHPLTYLTVPPIYKYREMKGFAELDRILPMQIYNYLFFSDISGHLIKQLHTTVPKLRFNPHSKELDDFEFLHIPACENNKKCSENTFLVSDTNLRSIINRRQSLNLQHNFNFQPYSSVINHLVFTDSSYGRIYYSPYASKYNLPIITFYNIEKDGMFHHNTMQALGRFLLFRIINPTKKFHIELAITNTFDGNRNNKITSANVVGNNRLPFPVMGRGSARVFSPPISPQVINKSSYILIDMSNGSFNKLKQTQPLLDARQIITYGRNISAISEKEYQQLNPPSIINKFPNDLANDDLEYSGIYEDGWISEDSYFKLKQTNHYAKLLIKGMIPKIDEKFDTNITILVDGKRVFQQLLTLGDFDLKIPIHSNKVGNKKVEIHFSKFQYLPNGDGRPTVALMKTIGFIG